MVNATYGFLWMKKENLFLYFPVHNPEDPVQKDFFYYNLYRNFFIAQKENPSQTIQRQNPATTSLA